MTISVALAMPGDRSEQAVLASVEQDRRFHVVRRCLEVTELLALAQAGLMETAVLTSTKLRWDSEVIARLVACSVNVIALAKDEADAAFFRKIGIRNVLADDVLSPGQQRHEELLKLMEARPAVDASGRGFAHAVQQDQHVEMPEALTTTMVSIWGPTGAPGRSTLACSLASYWASCGREVLLIDADPYGGSLGLMMGVNDLEVSGLSAACRLAHHGRLTASSLVDLVRQVSPNLGLLTGLVRTERWPELRPVSLEVVWEIARSVCDVVVVDAGFCLEEDEELSYDSMVARRNAATISALSCANATVAIGNLDVIGLTRLLRGLDQFQQVRRCPPHVIVGNRGTGRARQKAVKHELQAVLDSTYARTPVVVIPDDPMTCRKALAQGVSPLELHTQSALAQAVIEVAHNLIPHDQAHPLRGPNLLQRLAS